MTSGPLRILVTGWSGQVGAELLKVLPELGNLYLAGFDGAPTPDGIANVRENLHLDLSDPVSIAKVMREVKPHFVVNPAAYTAVDKAETDRTIALQVNGVAPGVLAVEAKALGSPIIHYSTDYVFDGAGCEARDEDAATGPLNYYGETKLVGEKAIIGTGGPYVIFRTSWVVSSHGHNFIKTMLKLGSEREELKVVADQIGAPTSAGFIARATLAALDASRKVGEMPSGVFNLVCAGETSWHGFAEEIFRQAATMGFPLKVKRVLPISTSDWPTPANRPLNSRLATEKFRRDFGVNPPHWRDELTVILKELQSK